MSLALLYHQMGRFDKAESRMQEVLAECQATLGVEQRDTRTAALVNAQRVHKS